MRFYPVFLNTRGQKVVFSGAGEHSASKIRLLLKSEAAIEVFGVNPCPIIRQWAEKGLLQLHERPLTWEDVADARLVYGANNCRKSDAEAVELGRWAGALTNVIDDLEMSDFLTPAIVDRDPVVVAIGTEGTAPVLARKIKAELEGLLPVSTGLLAEIAGSFRDQAAKLLSPAKRRAFWSRFFFSEGARSLETGGPTHVKLRLKTLLHEVKQEKSQPGKIAFIGAGSGEPDLLTFRAHKHLHEAEIVIHDHDVSPAILELARREATRISVKETQDITDLMIDHAKAGASVVRLKTGNVNSSDGLQAEITSTKASRLSWEVVPGVAVQTPTLKAGNILPFASQPDGVLTAPNSLGFDQNSSRKKGVA